MTELARLERKGITVDHLTVFAKDFADNVWIKRTSTFFDGPYKGKRLCRELMLTPLEYQQLLDLEVED